MVVEIASRNPTYSVESPKEFADTYGITVIGIFGSYARNEQGPDSNVDVLLEVREDVYLDLLDLERFQNELTDLLGIRAHVALKRNLRKRVGNRILREVVVL